MTEQFSKLASHLDSHLKIHVLQKTADSDLVSTYTSLIKNTLSIDLARTAQASGKQCNFDKGMFSNLRRGALDDATLYAILIHMNGKFY